MKCRRDGITYEERKDEERKELEMRKREDRRNGRRKRNRERKRILRIAEAGRGTREEKEKVS